MSDSACDRFIVFDLDDTLFPEHDYVYSGFHAVGELLRQQGIEKFESVATSLFQRGMRGTVFNTALAELGFESSELLISDLVATYRSHIPQLKLFPDASWALNRYSTITKLGLLSDGHALAQRNKFNSLNIKKAFAATLFTDELGRDYWKPSPAPFQKIAKMLACSSQNRLVYVADNPRKDFLAPNRLGWDTVRIRRAAAEYASLEPIDEEHRSRHEISSLEELPKVLGQ